MHTIDADDASNIIMSTVHATLDRHRRIVALYLQFNEPQGIQVVVVAGARRF